MGVQVRCELGGYCWKLSGSALSARVQCRLTRASLSICVLAAALFLLLLLCADHHQPAPLTGIVVM